MSSLNSNLAIVGQASYGNVIPFKIINGNRDKNDSAAEVFSDGKECEVYAFKTKEEIAAMINVFDKHIEEAATNDRRQIAYRNKMLFIIGINVGIRASDLRTLKWEFFFDKQQNGSLKFKDSYKFKPMKTRKTGKYVKINFNKAVYQIINSYIEEFPIDSLDDYLFPSQKGNDPVTVNSLRKIIKAAANEAGIEQNIGTHSLRKTFGKFFFDSATDKEEALVLLSLIFSHSSTAITRRYIGITDEKIKDAFENLNLGLDYI